MKRPNNNKPQKASSKALALQVSLKNFTIRKPFTSNQEMDMQHFHCEVYEFYDMSLEWNSR